MDDEVLYTLPDAETLRLKLADMRIEGVQSEVLDAFHNYLLTCAEIEHSDGAAFTLMFGVAVRGATRNARQQALLFGKMNTYAELLVPRHALGAVSSAILRVRTPNSRN